ncbi:MAG TPA: copper homeostasis membrane protein CopD [Pseudolabrys sp.]|nr:copper homeostasis membrane protein CopD [Pseudolabrys sp.]
MTELLAAVRAIHFAATVLAAGTVFFRVLVAEPAFRSVQAPPVIAIGMLRRRWSWTVWIALVMLALSLAAWLMLLTANILGEPLLDVCTRGDFWTVLGSTRFGFVCCVRLSLAVLLALALIPPTSATRSPWNAILLLLAGALLVAPAWIGHAGATPGTAGDIHLASDILHLLAAGAWLGALPPLAMLIAHARRAHNRTWEKITSVAVHRFSLIGVASVATLLASGIVNSWNLIGSVNNLIATDYGRIVLLKIGLFAAMVGIATVNRFYLTPRLADADAARQLQYNSVAETGLGLAALLFVGVLGTMQPVAHSHAHAAYAPVAADAAFVHIHSEDGMADVTLTPGRVGTARVTIRLWKEDLTELSAQAVGITLAAPSGGAPIVRNALQRADGSWEIGGIPLAEAGNWEIVVDVTFAAGRRLALDAPIVIEP